jgi:hypothetical protein
MKSKHNKKHLSNSQHRFRMNSPYFYGRALAPIVHFVPSACHDDVSRSYAVDRDGRVYLIGEGVILTDTANVAPFLEDGQDPYDYYYDNNIVTDSDTAVKAGISYFTFRHKPFTLRYHPDAGAFYDGTVARQYTDAMALCAIKVDKERKHMSRDEFIALIRAFGLERGFAPLHPAACV